MYILMLTGMTVLVGIALVSPAHEHDLTVLGFVRQDRFNIYTGSQRIRQAVPGSVVRSQRSIADTPWP